MQHGFFRAIQRSASMWITQEAHLDDRIRSLYSEQFVFRSVTHTEAKTTETKMTQLRDSKRSAADDDAPAGRYYPAAGMWRLPGAVPRRRRRATVLQGARLRRVRERGRGDRHVPVLRRGPVAAAAAAGGGLLERRGDRARAAREVVRQQ